MTAFNNQILVFGGEPSSAPRNPVELSDAYVLDTSKIRYPEEKPGPKTGAMRRPSISDRTGNGTPQKERSTSQDGSVSSTTEKPLNMKGSQDSIASMTGNYSRPQELVASYGPNGFGAKGPRTGVSPVPSGPPPSQALPQPRTNGMRAQPQGPAEGGRESPWQFSKAERVLGATNLPGGTPYTQSRDVNGTRGPGSTGMISPQDDPYAPSAQYSHEQQSSQDSGLGRRTETPDAAARAGEDLIQSNFKLQPAYPDSGVGSSPALSTQQASEGLARELESLRSKNAWYASELALAKKAGYRSSSTESPSSLLDERTADAFGDEEKPLLEALLRMRAELSKVQDSLTAQSALAAEKISQAEREKQAAVEEALYLRTQSASRDGTFAADSGSSARSEDASRRLASTLAAHNELQSQVEHLTSSLEAERKAREAAEESANAAHARATDLDAHKQQSVSELESLRGELHETQRLAREHSTKSADALSSSRMLQVDKDDLSSKLLAAQQEQQTHASVLLALQSAVTASSGKSSLLERQLEEERQQRAVAEDKLAQLRAEHETRVAELDSTTRKLRDSEDLVQHHATEANTHREALLAGLQTTTSRDLDGTAMNDQRVVLLQQSLDEAKAVAQQHREAADHAANRLRSAEERIAGLETYQEQSSREGLSLRKQIQAASRDALSQQAEHSELQQQLSKHKLELTAWQMQHSTLRNILGDRGIDINQLPKDMNDYQLSNSNAQRLQQLEEQIETSSRAQEEMRQTYESREQELRKTRDAEYHALENECQQMREYIEGFHDVAEKLKKNIKKEKAENQSLREELEREKQPSTSTAAGSFGTERASLQQQIESLQARVNQSQADLEQQVQKLQVAMTQANTYKDESMRYQRELEAATSQNRSDLEALRSHNAQLETRAQEAENRVKTLLDSVGTSVNNYRRQSQNVSQLNGISGHSRGLSTNSAGGASVYSSTSLQNGIPEIGVDRSSAVFDSFVTELDNLRNQWENTSKTLNNRLSDRSVDAADSAAPAAGDETAVSNSMADWRRRLELDDDDDDEIETSSHAAPKA